SAITTPRASSACPCRGAGLLRPMSASPTDLAASLVFLCSGRLPRRAPLSPSRPLALVAQSLLTVFLGFPFSPHTNLANLRVRLPLRVHRSASSGARPWRLHGSPLTIRASYSQRHRSIDRRQALPAS